MGRIVAVVKATGTAGSTFTFPALVDTGAAYVVLPSTWKGRFSNIEKLADVPVELGDQTRRSGEIYGPIKLQLEGFRPIFTEVLFLEMVPRDGEYEPLLGYIPLEQSLAAVDMASHTLVPVKAVDVK